MATLSLRELRSAPKPGTVLDEAHARQAHRGVVSSRRRRLLPRYGRRPDLHQRGDRGPQHVAGLDWRQRSPLGRARRTEPRLAGLPENSFVSPEAARFARQPLGVPGPGQRAVFHEADRTGSQPLRAMARRARSRMPAGPVRERRTNTRASKSARAAGPCRSAPTTASPPASSGLRLFPNPDFDEAARRDWDSETLLQRPARITCRRDLVRPYRIGMSCAFCHVGRIR